MHNKLSAPDKEKQKKRNRLSTFGKILFTRKTAKASNHHITMPITYMQNDHRNSLGLPKLEQNFSSCPDLTRISPGLVKSKSMACDLDGFIDPKQRSRSEMPLPPLPCNQKNGTAKLNDQTKPKWHCKSVMPLPLTPLDLATIRLSSDSISTTSSNSTSTECLLPPILSTTKMCFDDITSKVTENDNLNVYEEVDSVLDLQRKSVLLNCNIASTVNDETPFSPDYVVSDEEFYGIKKDAGRQKNAPATSDEMSSEASINEGSLLTTNVLTALNKETITFLSKEEDEDEEEDYVINDIEFSETVKQMQQTSSIDLAIAISDAVLSSLNIDPVGKQACEQQGGHNGAKEKYDKGPTQVEANIYDSITSECETHADQCTASEPCKCPELKCLDSDIRNYIFMHKVTCPSLKEGPQVYTYDYIDQLYIEMLRRKKYPSGIPPRNVKRTGYQPSVDISTYSSAAKKMHVTYVNCSNINKLHGTTLLPPRECHADNLDKSNVKVVTPSRNIPRLGCYLSAPPAKPAM